MDKIKKNVYTSVILFAFSLIMIFYAIPTQISVNNLLGGDSTIVNSRFFPYLIAAIIGVLSAVEFVFSVISMAKLSSNNHAHQKEPPKGTIIAMSVFALFVIYLLVFAQLGFIISSAIVPPIVLWLLGSRKWQHYLSYYGVMAATYFVFVYALKISLP